MKQSSSTKRDLAQKITSQTQETLKERNTSAFKQEQFVSQEFGTAPIGYNTINTFVVVKDSAVKFIEFTKLVFGAEERANIRTPDRDGKLIHAEITLGNSTIMIADSKDDWPFTPSFLQIYVEDANKIIEAARSRGATIVTELTPFYGGYNIARIQDPFGNIWWLYEAKTETAEAEIRADTSWHKREPSYVYTTLMEAMKKLRG